MNYCDGSFLIFIHNYMKYPSKIICQSSFSKKKNLFQWRNNKKNIQVSLIWISMCYRANMGSSVILAGLGMAAVGFAGRYAARSMPQVSLMFYILSPLVIFLFCFSPIFLFLVLAGLEMATVGFAGRYAALDGNQNGWGHDSDWVLLPLYLSFSLPFALSLSLLHTHTLSLDGHQDEGDHEDNAQAGCSYPFISLSLSLSLLHNLSL